MALRVTLPTSQPLHGFCYGCSSSILLWSQHTVPPGAVTCTAVLCTVWKPLCGNVTPTSLPNLPFFSPEENMAGHTWQVSSWPHELVLDVSVTCTFFLFTAFSCLPVFIEVYAEADTNIMGFVESLAFCIHLAWYSLYKCLTCHNWRPRLLQKYLLLRAETEWNHFLIDDTKQQALFSIPFSPFPFHLLEAVICLTRTVHVSVGM